jgi:hypothetical protein
MEFIVPDPDDIIPGPIDSGHSVGCTVEGCGGMAAVLWVDRSIPWISILCAEHGRESLPSTSTIANLVLFEGCPESLQRAALERAGLLHRHEAYAEA